MPDTDQTTQPGGEGDPLAAMEERLVKLIKSSVAGSVGSATEQINKIAKTLDDAETQRRRALVDQMSPEQAKEFAKKAITSAEDGGDKPKVDQYYSRQARELLADFEVDMEAPTFEPGHTTAYYEDAYAAFRRKVSQTVNERNKSEAVKVAEAKVNELLAAKGLNIADAGPGAGQGAPGKFTRKQLADMTVEEYEKARDAIFAPG